jgi:DNA-binding transcriptional ArsR family regulator
VVNIFEGGEMANQRGTQSKHAAGANAALFKALSHPLRGRMMVLLTEAEGCAVEIADRLGETLQNTSYHMRQLRDAGLIAHVRTSQNRGGTATFYKATARPILDIDSWEELPQLIREVNSVWVLQLLIGDAVEAIQRRTFDARAGRTLVRVPLVVDEEGWEELEPAAKRYLETILDIQAKSSERLMNSSQESINISASVAAFEVPSPGTHPTSQD